MLRTTYHAAVLPISAALLQGKDRHVSAILQHTRKISRRALKPAIKTVPRLNLMGGGGIKYPRIWIMGSTSKQQVYTLLEMSSPV
jgi:hypothetical protein